MIKFEWKLNGRTVAPDQIGRELAKSIEGEVIERAKSAVGRTRCPVHGSSPRNIRVSRSGDRLHFQYDSCCDRLQEAVARSIK
jgi:hypothetical protein